MRPLAILLFVISICSYSASAQKTIFNQDFESVNKGQNILKFEKQKLKAWGESQWTVKEKKGKGFAGSNKYVSCGNKQNSTLVRYENLEVGSTYVFSVAVKVNNPDAQSWKSNYTVKVTSGKKGDIHRYGEDKMVEPKNGKWIEHKIEFTVVEGRENVILQVYRFAASMTLSADNFKLIKK